MKINQTTNSTLEKLGLGGVAPKTSNTKADKADKSADDAVSFSSLSSQLQALESKLASGQEFDAGKVASIQQAIREGKFKVNPEVVADKLLASVNELMGKSS